MDNQFTTMDVHPISQKLQQQLTRLQTLLFQQDNLDQLNLPSKQNIVNKAIVALQDLQRCLNPSDGPTVKRYLTMHDGEMHDPLGAGSYMFQKSFISSVIRTAGLPTPTDQNGSPLLPQKLTIHIGAQPNNSPHSGTLVVFFKAFIVAKEILEYYKNLSRDGMSEEFARWIDNFRVAVHLDLVDTAPDNTISQPKAQHTRYQRSLRNTQAVRRFAADYDEILQLAADRIPGIEVDTTVQGDLTGMKCFPGIIEQVVENRERLARLLAPDTGVLAMRVACPYEGCGLADKHGVHNEYTVDPCGSVTISFMCPNHGRHQISTLNPEDVRRLEFNTPLRNLVRAIAYALDTFESRQEVMEGKEGAYENIHIRVTGSDYAGLYADQMFWRAWPLIGFKEKSLDPPLVLYAPLIVDWAGSKLSKSLYVKAGAYEYLKEREMNYLLSFDEMKKTGKDPLVLFQLVESWVKEPKKLFRCFSAEYLHMIFCEEKDGLLES